ELVTMSGVSSGAQGGSVARALLKDPAFAVRAVTRDTTKPAAVELAGLGAQLVKVDLASQAEVEAALKGVYGTFLVTNFWEHFDKSKEVQQGKMVADLAKKLGLKHVVYSGLENVNRITGGKLTVLHFDGKGEVEEYFRTISVPMTSVRLPFYFENFISFFKPTKTGPDTYSVGLPMGDVPMDGMSVADLGPVVLSILKSREEFVGKDIGLSADRLTVVQYSEVMTRCLGKTFTDGKVQWSCRIRVFTKRLWLVFIGFYITEDLQGNLLPLTEEGNPHRGFGNPHSQLQLSSLFRTSNQTSE
ncbi:NMRL1 protein, partial [Amia calva]|nr:NMRL1 protein [Amia calva]